MKTVLSFLLLFVLALGAGYYGAPLLIAKETERLKSDIQSLNQRLEKIEEFARGDEEAGKDKQLLTGADSNQIIKSVNAISAKVASLDDTFRKRTAETDAAIKNQVDKINKDAQARIQKITFDAYMASIRSHILKARTDILYQNIGTARVEFDLIADAFEKTKASATEENKKVINELQGILKKAREEMGSDLPSVINRVDLLWHEMSKLLKKA